MKKSRQFVMILVMTVLICVFLKFALGFYVIYMTGSVKKHESWVYETFVVKKYLAQIQAEKPSPHLIVVSGSNALFGYNNTILENELGLPIINMAAHASLSIDYLLWRTLPYIQKNDIVLMPLEWDYYVQEKTSWLHDNITYWDKSYIKSLPLLKQIQWVGQDDLKVAYHSLFKVKKIPDSATILENWRMQKPSDRTNYDYLYMRPDGSFIPKPESALPIKSHKYLEMPTQKQLETIKKYKEMIEKKGAYVIFTYPVMMKSAKFDMSQPSTKQLLKSIQEELKKYGIEQIGDIHDFIYEQSDFLDTYYHLKESTSRIHSHKLGQFLKKYLKSMMGEEFFKQDSSIQK